MSNQDHHANFSAQASYYVKYRPAYPQKMYDFILQQVNDRGKAWDCATGNGQVALVLASAFQQVTATDASQEQLDQARLHPRITYRKAPAEHTPFPNNTFDLITVAQAIHWFDIGRFYEEVRRTARPGAILAVIGYGRVVVDAELNTLIHDFYQQMFSRHFNQNRQLVDKHYSTLPFPFEEIPAPAFSSEYVWTLDELHGYFHSWSAVQRYKNECGEDPTVAVIEQIKPLWGEKRKVQFPVFMKMGKIN